MKKSTEVAVPVHYHIDYPKAEFQQVLGSPLNIEGWAVFPEGLVHFVEVFINDMLEFHGRLNTMRPDVVRALDLKHESELLGFELRIQLSQKLPQGKHTLKLRFHDESGRRSGFVAVAFTSIADDGQKSYSSRFSEIPQYLVAKVNRDLSEAVFTAIGEGVRDQIIEACAEIKTAHSVLDFGCGLGRVLDPLRKACPDAKFTGYDIDPLMLRWCRHLHGNAPWLELSHSTLGLPDSSFDVVYAISVFTHLDVTSEYWLHEIHRVLKPGGIAFLTYHDETLFADCAGGPDLPGTSIGDVLQGAFIVGKGTAEGGAAMGTFYETRVWESLLGRFFHVESTKPRGLRGHQSFTVVRKVSQSAVAPDPIPYLAHLEEELFKLRDKVSVAY